MKSRSSILRANYISKLEKAAGRQVIQPSPPKVSKNAVAGLHSVRSEDKNPSLEFEANPASKSGHKRNSQSVGLDHAVIPLFSLQPNSFKKKEADQPKVKERASVIFKSPFYGGQRSAGMQENLETSSEEESGAQSNRNSLTMSAQWRNPNRKIRMLEQPREQREEYTYGFERALNFNVKVGDKIARKLGPFCGKMRNKSRMPAGRNQSIENLDHRLRNDRENRVLAPNDKLETIDDDQDLQTPDRSSTIFHSSNPDLQDFQTLSLNNIDARQTQPPPKAAVSILQYKVLSPPKPLNDPPKTEIQIPAVQSPNIIKKQMEIISSMQSQFQK